MAFRDGDFSPENLENVFNTMLGDAQVVDSVIVPRSIPEDVAQDRLDNIRDSDFLYKILKSKDIGCPQRLFYPRSLSVSTQAGS
jgi:hypothetical protein